MTARKGRVPEDVKFYDAVARARISSEMTKIAHNNHLFMRDEFARLILCGICSGDWKFEIPEGKTWDQIAARRAYDLADAMMKEREISFVEPVCE